MTILLTKRIQNCDLLDLNHFVGTARKGIYFILGQDILRWDNTISQGGGGAGVGYFPGIRYWLVQHNQLPAFLRQKLES
jgi:hypothetical protein